MSYFKKGFALESHLPVQTLLMAIILATLVQPGLAQTDTAGGEEQAPAPLAGDQVQVNINEADAATIADILVGIGVSRAAAIVEYREQHGDFTSLEQLIEVNGVGEATVFNNKDRIRFE
ncbi:MAG: ComE operon protein 1 [Pseudomonadota bacterium]|jgi:competence protein ComEA